MRVHSEAAKLSSGALFLEKTFRRAGVMAAVFSTSSVACRGCSEPLALALGEGVANDEVAMVGSSSEARCGTCSEQSVDTSERERAWSSQAVGIGRGNAADSERARVADKAGRVRERERECVCVWERERERERERCGVQSHPRVCKAWHGMGGGGQARTCTSHQKLESSTKTSGTESA